MRSCVVTGISGYSFMESAGGITGPDQRTISTALVKVALMVSKFE